ncbi:MAG: universal stress protein [Polyangiaceae bacterium]
MFKHILLATDFSKSALLAAGAAHDIAKKLGAKVTLMNVVAPGTDGGVALRQGYLEVLRNERFGDLDAGVVAVESDRASFAICERAGELGADLIVAGRHGEHTLTEKLIGSTTERIARYAPCSVFVAQPTRRDPLVLLEHVLVGTDFSDESAPAVETASGIAKAFGAGVTLMHVYDIFPPLELLLGPESGNGQFRALLEDKLEETRRKHLDGVPGDTALLRDKSTVTAMCDWADDHHVDLVVLGTHGLTGLPRLLLGSVAERVIRHAPCSALVIRGTN